MQRDWAPVTEQIARRYCRYPDLIQGAKGAELAAMRLFCIKPDGKSIHNITWEPADDLRSLNYSLQGIIDAMRAGKLDTAAQHAGVLSHFLADSTCPAHSLIPVDSPLESMSAQFAPPDQQGLQLHQTIERSAPQVDLTGRAPRRESAEVLLARCYRVVRGNRESLETLVKAVYAHDEATVDRMRREAAERGAELLADAYYTALLAVSARAREKD
jgi:hypothetical protein